MGTPYSVGKLPPQPVQRSADSACANGARQSGHCRRASRARATGRPRAGGAGRCRGGGGARRRRTRRRTRSTRTTPPRARASATARRRVRGRAGRPRRPARRARAGHPWCPGHAGRRGRAHQRGFQCGAVTDRRRRRRRSGRATRRVHRRMRMREQASCVQALAEDGLDLFDGEEVALDVRSPDVHRQVRQELAQAVGRQRLEAGHHHRDSRHACPFSDGLDGAYQVSSTSDASTTSNAPSRKGRRRRSSVTAWSSRPTRSPSKGRFT